MYNFTFFPKMNNDLPVGDDIHECDKYLSAFGRKVFGVLLKQYTTGEFTRSKYQFSKNTLNRHEVSLQRRNERNNPLSGTNIHFTNVNYDIDGNIYANQEYATSSPNNSSGILLEKENTQAMPKITDLAKGTEDLEITDANTNIIMTPNSSQIANSQPNLNMGKNIENFTLYSTENNEAIKPTKEVTWGDMFDCEILNAETCNNEQKLEKLDKTNVTKDTNNIFELTSRNKKPKMTKTKCTVESKKLVINEKGNEKNIVSNNSKVTEHTSTEVKRKRKNKNSDSTQAVTTVPKEVAKVTEKKLKPKFLKRKNSKAINNWLDKVDPTHLVDGIDIQSEVLIPSTPNNVGENPNDILQTSFGDVECQDRHAKMVQAKLVNENGAMKFSKPNNINGLTQPINEENSTAKEMNKTKMKKSKFVAPIKSQNSSKNI